MNRNDPLDRDLFTHVNDSIRKLASETQSYDFICECPEVTCRAAVRLTLIEFDERRSASPPVPVLAPEHDGVQAGWSSQR